MNGPKKLKISVLVVLALLAAAALFRGLAPRQGAAKQADPVFEAYRNRTTVALSGTYWDFSPADGATGHPDFGLSAPDGGGRYAGIAADRLAPDGAPVLHGTGLKVSRQWLDAQGRPIIPPRSYIDALAGDQEGAMSSVEGGAVTSAETFAQWFRDTPGVNTASHGRLVVTRPGYPGVFEFSGFLDQATPTGGAETSDGNASTTYAAETTFIYERGTGQYIEAETDASAWVYIGDRLVIDAGAAAALPWEFTGISVNGPITVEQNSQIVVDSATTGFISTNATAPGSVRLANSARMIGDLKLGPGADPAVVVDGISRITGAVSVLAEPIAIPSVNFPTFVGESRGNVTHSGEAVTWGDSFRCDTLTVDGTSVITVTGNINVVCDGDFVLRNSATINIEPGASLDIYTRGTVNMDNSIRLNVNTRDPSLCTIYATGTAPIELPNTVEVYANFVAPSATMTVGQQVRAYGSFFGAGLIVRNQGYFTVFNAGTNGRRGSQLIMTQRIDLDRCNWLDDGRTYPLKVFFADRNQPKSPLTLRTNIDTLNLAAPLPRINERD